MDAGEGRWTQMKEDEGRWMQMKADGER